MAESSNIFLSYSRDDQATARRFAEALERAGFSVWWDQTLRTGENYDRVTEAALRAAKAVVVLWSKKSVDSQWVRAEATQADRNGTLMPVMIEPCNRPIMFELKHTADLSGWNGEANDKSWLNFLSDVQDLVQGGSPASAPVGAPQGTHAISGGSPRWLARAIAISVVALLVAGSLVWMLNRVPGDTGAEPAPSAGAPGAVTAAPTTVSLAVLPFADMSAAGDQEYFSDGLSEEILNQLAQNKALRITGRTSSFSFKGKNEDLRVIGEKLGVANLLEGSIRKDGARLRVTAQLISSKDGSHLWSKTYARDMSDIFAVQEEIAKDVARALSVTLDVGDMRRAEGGTTNIDAYDKYLQARSLLYQGGGDQFLRAAQLEREAVALDPNFARAWLGLRAALLGSMIWTPENKAALYKEMEEAAARVAALAPNAWSTKAMRARNLAEHPGGDREWAEAFAAASEALSIAPKSDLDALLAYAMFLMHVGRTRDAIAHLGRMKEADPLALNVSGFLQLALDSAGQPDEADAEHERSKALTGDHGQWEHFALLRLMARPDADPAMVKTRFTQFLGRETVPMKVNHDLVRLLDDKPAARASIRLAFDDPVNQTWTRLVIIRMYADRFGDRDLALAALRRAFLELDEPSYPAQLWLPYVTNLRTDPLFKELVRELGLVDYWRSSGNWGDHCKPVGAGDFECN